uniref:Uncharacterized protein n=1 Tax=Myotis myotis TaxID=51298 RepID=A0A7J7S1Q9_MYOMY|nr:hypothetical protein mMyoMyo1_010037 [Myotis myotis]
MGPDADPLCTPGEPQAPSEMGMGTPLLTGMMAEFNATQMVAYRRAVRPGPAALCPALLGRIAHSPSLCVYKRPGRQPQVGMERTARVCGFIELPMSSGTLGFGLSFPVRYIETIGIAGGEQPLTEGRGHPGKRRLPPKVLRTAP